MFPPFLAKFHFFFSTHHVPSSGSMHRFDGGGRIFLKFHSYLWSVGSTSFDTNIIGTTDKHPRRHSNGLICRHQRWQQRPRWRRFAGASSIGSNSAAANGDVAASIAAGLTVLESTLGVGGATNTNPAGIQTVPSLFGRRAAYESIGTARLEAATGTGAGTSAGASADGGGANANNNAGTSVGGERTLLVRWAPSPPASAC